MNKNLIEGRRDGVSWHNTAKKPMGMSISGKLHWLHTASTPELVYLHIDKHRGEVALRAMGILEGFEGWVVHDFLAAYYRIDGLKHVLCKPHLLRDLIGVHENHGLADEACREFVETSESQPMSAPIMSMRNIGPRCAEWLAGIGIHSADDLRRIGAAAAYRELVSRGVVRPHRMLLYALGGAVDDEDCLQLSRERKRQLEEEAGV